MHFTLCNAFWLRVKIVQRKFCSFERYTVHFCTVYIRIRCRNSMLSLWYYRNSFSLAEQLIGRQIGLPLNTQYTCVRVREPKINIIDFPLIPSKGAELLYTQLWRVWTVLYISALSFIDLIHLLFQKYINKYKWKYKNCWIFLKYKLRVV